MATFIDFKELRAQLDFTRVLALYGVESTTIRNQQLTAPCPLPTHLGIRAKATFSADLARGIWRCFGCKTSGNVLDFAVRMEGYDQQHGPAVREVALKLQKHFLSETVPEIVPVAVKTTQGKRNDDVVVNTPLDFQLKALDPSHPAVGALGLNEATVHRFGLGYCARGLLRGRIAIPLHNQTGELISYAGFQSSPETADSPLYLFPADRRQDGALRRFSLDHFIYGAHWVGSQRLNKLIISDDISLVWHFWELGVPAVAIPSIALTPFQTDLLDELTTPAGRVFIGRSRHEPR